MSKAETASTREGEWRERIIDAAIRCLHQYGSEKLNVVDVAKRAKVSRATVYKYFGSRRELLDAVFGYQELIYFAELDREMRRCDRFDDQIATAILFVQDCWEDPAHAAWTGFVSPADEPFLLLERFGRNFEVHTRAMKPYVVMAQERGELRADLDPEAVAEWVTRIVLSYSVSHASVPAKGREAVVEFVRAHLVRGLR